MKDNTLAIMLGMVATGLGLYTILGKSQAAGAAGGGGGGLWDWLPGGNSEKTPTMPTDEMEGVSPADAPAAQGAGETATENLYTTIPDKFYALIGGDDSRYEQRKVSELTGITEQQYLNRWQQIIGEKSGGFGAGIKPPELGATERYIYGFADTLEIAEYQAERNKLIARLGGVWQGGQLTVGASGFETVSAMSEHISQELSKAETPPPDRAYPESWEGRWTAYIPYPTTEPY